MKSADNLFDKYRFRQKQNLRAVNARNVSHGGL